MSRQHGTSVLNHNVNYHVGAESRDSGEQEVEDAEMPGGGASKAEQATVTPGAKLSARRPARDQEQVAGKNAGQEGPEDGAPVPEEVPRE